MRGGGVGVEEGGERSSSIWRKRRVFVKGNNEKKVEERIKGVKGREKKVPTNKLKPMQIFLSGGFHLGFRGEGASVLEYSCVPARNWIPDLAFLLTTAKESWVGRAEMKCERGRGG